MDEAAEPLISEEDRNFVPGDLVWGKLKNHQWWPGLVVDPSSDSTVDGFDRNTKESYLLVDFIESTMPSTWCKVSELRPFVSDYKIVILASRSSRRESGFSAAMEKALEELRRRIEVKMMCESAPDEARRKLDGPGELRTYGQSIVDGLGTDVFLQMYHDAACNVSSVDLLESVVMQGWIAAFFRETGTYVPLPVYHMFEGIENFGEVKVKAKKERSMVELIAETDLEADNYEDESLVKVNVVEDVRRFAGRKRKNKREEDDNNNYDDGDDDDEQEEEEERTVEQLQDAASDNDGDDVGKEEQHGTGSRRERKKSKYLSPPYTMMNSRTIVKCNKKSFVFDQYNGASADELLSEFRLVALDTTYLVEHQDDNIIRGFFDSFRNSVFNSGSYFEEYNSKCLDSSDGGDVMTSPSSESDMFSLEGKPGGFQIVKDNGISKSKTPKQMKSPASKENGDADDKVRSPEFDVNLLAEAQQNSYVHEGNDLKKIKFSKLNYCLLSSVTEIPEIPSALCNSCVTGSKRKCLVHNPDPKEETNTKLVVVDIEVNIPPEDHEFFSCTEVAEGNILVENNGSLEPKVKKGSKGKSSTDKSNGSTEVKCRGRPKKVAGNSSTPVSAGQKDVLFPGIPFSDLQLYLGNPIPPPSLILPLPKPPLCFVKKSLERMITTLNTFVSSGKDVNKSSIQLNPDAREKLVREMSGLLTKVNKLLASKKL